VFNTRVHRFRSALQRQQESFTKQLEGVEAELRRSLQTVRERDASVRALADENDALKDTVKSLVSSVAPRCMNC
jgi:hypothetical protein